MGFAQNVRVLCEPSYREANRGGRPEIDPVVYFKMLMVEFFENLGVDLSVIEANASLRSLEHRNTEQSYWKYVKGLAVEAGVDPEDGEAVRRFDKKRPARSTSNKDWKKPSCRGRQGGPDQGRSL